MTAGVGDRVVILVGGFEGITGDVIQQARRYGRVTGGVKIRTHRVPKGWPADRNELWYVENEYVTIDQDG